MTQMHQSKTALEFHGNFLPLLKDLSRILSLTSQRRKFQLFGLLVLQILGGFTEIISLGALLPFLSALSNASEFIARPQLQEAIKFLGIKTTQDLILFSSFAFAIAFFSANILKTFIFGFRFVWVC